MNWRKIPDYIPGVGLVSYGIREYKARKGKFPWYNLKESKDRKALGVYALEIGYLAFALSWKFYLGKSVATGNWNPFEFNPKDKTELINEKKNSLEKSINYEEILNEDS